MLRDSAGPRSSLLPGTSFEHVTRFSLLIPEVFVRAPREGYPIDDSAALMPQKVVLVDSNRSKTFPNEPQLWIDSFTKRSRDERRPVFVTHDLFHERARAIAEMDR